MIETVNLSTLMAIAMAVTTIGGAWLTIRRISKDSARQKEIHGAKILQAAKEADQALRLKLESRVHELENDLESLKDSVAKDIAHLRETYNGEIKFLGQKIEELRSEVRNQHGQLVQLLSKMIENKD
jgi:hypothetical protein